MHFCLSPIAPIEKGVSMEVFLPFLLNSFISHAHTQGNVMLHCHFCIDVGDRNNAECDNGRGGSGDLLSLSC